MNRNEAEKAAREIAWTMFRAPSEQVARMSAYPDCHEKRVMAMADIIERAGGQDAMDANEAASRAIDRLGIKCGSNSAGLSNEKTGGCGQVISGIDHIFRCADCQTPFCSQRCIKKHFPEERPCGETAWVSELLAATKMMCESLPLYSPSSAAFTRKGRLDAAIKAAEKFCAGGSLKSAISVKADLEHPGNDTGGESAESLLPSPPTAEDSGKLSDPG